MLNVKRIEIVDDWNAVRAYRNDSGPWADPHGGTFTTWEQEQLDRIATGERLYFAAEEELRFPSLSYNARVRVAF